MKTIPLTLPNFLSLSRLGLIVVLWVLALRGEALWVGIVLIVAGGTDILDGWIARHWGLTTPLGSKLDSLADNFLFLSAAAWLAMLEPSAIRQNVGLIVVALGSYALSLAIGWFKFRRVSNLHLYSAKLGAIIQALFLLHTFATPGYSRPFLWVALGSFIFSSLEECLVQLRANDVNEHIGSIFHLRGSSE
jgi:CDP-diacylglycerol--glycerol-3-phosphate 3-phosphatidyltransferase